MARRGYGDAAIRADLKKRLIPSEVVAEAIASLEPEVDRARRVLDTGALSAKTVRRLGSRGFSRQTIDEIATAFAE